MTAIWNYHCHRWEVKITLVAKLAVEMNAKWLILKQSRQQVPCMVQLYRNSLHVCKHTLLVNSVVMFLKTSVLQDILFWCSNIPLFCARRFSFLRQNKNVVYQDGFEPFSFVSRTTFYINFNFCPVPMSKWVRCQLYADTFRNNCFIYYKF